MSIDRGLLRSGFVVLLLALLIGLAISLLFNPRLATATHVNGTIQAVLLIVLSVVWEALRLAPGRAKIVRGLYLYGAYASLAAGLLAPIRGTSGVISSVMPFAFVQAIFLSVWLALLAATVLVVLSFFRRGR